MNSTEDDITFLFAGELRVAVERASQKGEIETAFLRDLRQSILMLSHDIAHQMRGLVARVSRHNRSHEGKMSGADLGIIIRRPLVRIASDGNRIEFQRDHVRGLLVQAKLGQQSNSVSETYAWGRLTRRQKTLYQVRRDYYSLLLYRLDGQTPDMLRPFGWQLCKEYDVKDVQKWLRDDNFPQQISSCDVLHRLFAGIVGTDDVDVVEDVIDPPKLRARSIAIHIFWPDGLGPPTSLRLHTREEQHQVARLRQ